MPSPSSPPSAPAPAPAPLRPKHVPPRPPLVSTPPPLVSTPPPLVPARMINEVLYCERLAYLEWAQGEFRDNAFTVEGRAVHRRADAPGGALPPKRKKADAADPADEEPPAPSEELPYRARAVWLSSERHGITAKIDVVEGDESGRVVPIEYKRGAPPDVPEGAYLPERAQLCAQVLVLRDNGYACDEGAIWFAAGKRRVPIAIDEALVATTLAAVARLRDLASRAELPPPLDDSPKCDGCSLVGICLPDETNLLKRLRDEPLDAPAEAEAEPAPDPIGLDGPLDPDPWGLAVGVTELRRLHPARDDELPLYVQEQGARVSLDGERLVVTGRETGRVEARLPNTSQVCLLGNVQLTTPALRALLERGIPVSFFSRGGFYYGRASGHESKNVELRLAQHAAATEPSRCLAFARGFVVSKVKNSRTMLRRNASTADPVVLSQLDQLARKAGVASSLEELLGLEGSAARVYFGAFSGMLKDEAVKAGFDLDGRNRRPPRDPINALLSFAYALLTKDFALTLSAVGLDPMLGFYHQPRFGRPALALDLMEEFRPLVADSVVVGAINNGVVTVDDFARTADAAALGAPARRRFLQAYERRMDQLVTHPVFGYRISYRRVLEVQARLLGRVLLGEAAEYPPFRTR